MKEKFPLKIYKIDASCENDRQQPLRGSTFIMYLIMIYKDQSNFINILAAKSSNQPAFLHQKCLNEIEKNYYFIVFYSTDNNGNIFNLDMLSYGLVSLFSIPIWASIQN